MGCPDRHALMVGKKVFFICKVNQEVGYVGVGDDVVNLDMVPHSLMCVQESGDLSL